METFFSSYFKFCSLLPLNKNHYPKMQQQPKQRLSSLTLQVSLHLHVHLLPICLFSQLACFTLKFSILHPTYRVVLLALHLISVCVQLARPYLGYVDNLGERIPALSGFWILSALLHLPAQLFLGLNPDIHPLPLERYTILLDFCLSIVELISATFLIRRLAQRQMEYFRHILAQQQIGPAEVQNNEKGGNKE